MLFEIDGKLFRLALDFFPIEHSVGRIFFLYLHEKVFVLHCSGRN